MSNDLLLQFAPFMRILTEIIIATALVNIVWQSFIYISHCDARQAENAKMHIILTGFCLFFTLISFVFVQFLIKLQGVHQPSITLHPTYCKIMITFLLLILFFCFFKLLQYDFFTPLNNERNVPNTLKQSNHEFVELHKKPLDEFEKMVSLLDERYKKENL